jgi:hypothetical protein
MLRCVFSCRRANATKLFQTERVPADIAELCADGNVITNRTFSVTPLARHTLPDCLVATLSE